MVSQVPVGGHWRCSFCCGQRRSQGARWILTADVSLEWVNQIPGCAQQCSLPGSPSQPRTFIPVTHHKPSAKPSCSNAHNSTRRWAQAATPRCQGPKNGLGVIVCKADPPTPPAVEHRQPVGPGLFISQTLLVPACP